MDFDGPITCARDAIDDALHSVLVSIVEGEDDTLLDPESLRFVEGVVLEVVAADAIFAEASVIGERGVLADNAHAGRVVGLFPELVVAVDDFLDAGELAAADENIEAFENLVDSLADEGFHALGLARDLLDVPILELLRAIFEAREPRVTVDGVLGLGCGGVRARFVQGRS